MRVPPILFLAGLCFAGTAFLDATPNGDVVSHVKREAVNSSGIATIGYSKRLHALEIEFINGAIYRYFEVPPSLYRSLIAAESKARFYDQNIRGKYRSAHVRSRTRK